MILKTKSKSYLLGVMSAAFLGTAIYFHVNSPYPPLKISKQDSAVNLNDFFIKTFAIGNKRMISDIIWIKTMLESDMEKYSNRDLGNWLYLRFLTVSNLDPYFYENYQYGGLFLSIIKDDLEGAADIYERGIRIFPDDYKLNYQAGFNYYVEMGDFEKGLVHLKKVENHPEANQMIKFIIKKLEFEGNKSFENVIPFIEHQLSITNSPSLTKKLTADLFSLTTERDLECLNNNKDNCSLKNIEGHYYQKKDGKWVSPIPYVPYRIHRRDFLRPRSK